MGSALGVVLTTNVPVEGRAAVPVYVDDSLPIVGPPRAVVVMPADGTARLAGGPPMPVRLAPAGTPAIGPALPIYIVPGGGILVADPTLAYTTKVKALSPIAYWPLAEASGTTIGDESGNSRDGVYAGAPSLGQTGIGDGRTAPLFAPGSSQYGNVFSASLNTAFGGQEGTLAIWAKVRAASVWSDAAGRQLAIGQRDGANAITLFKSGTANIVTARYIAGGTTKSVNITAGPTTAWLHIAMTWSKAADQFIAYLNGAQSGAIQTGLGAHIGGVTNTTTCIAAASTAPALLWDGSLAHVAFWGTPLSAVQIAALATVP